MKRDSGWGATTYQPYCAAELTNWPVVCTITAPSLVRRIRSPTVREGTCSHHRPSSRSGFWHAV